MRIHPASRSFGLVLALGSLLACGACGGGGSEPGTSTVTFSALDGRTLHSNGLANGASGFHVGEEFGAGVRGGIRFPLFPFVDAGDTILSARLRVSQVSVAGSPYTTHGNIVVDVVDFGLSLDATDYGASVVASNVGTLSSDATLGFKEIDVTAQVIAAAAGNEGAVDFLLRSAAQVVSPGSDDFATFADHLSGGAEAPQLVVTYQ